MKSAMIFPSPACLTFLLVETTLEVILAETTWEDILVETTLEDILAVGILEVDTQAEVDIQTSTLSKITNNNSSNINRLISNQPTSSLPISNPLTSSQLISNSNPLLIQDINLSNSSHNINNLLKPRLQPQQLQIIPLLNRSHRSQRLIQAETARILLSRRCCRGFPS